MLELTPFFPPVTQVVILLNSQYFLHSLLLLIVIVIITFINKLNIFIMFNRSFYKQLFFSLGYIFFINVHIINESNYKVYLFICLLSHSKKKRKKKPTSIGYFKTTNNKKQRSSAYKVEFQREFIPRRGAGFIREAHKGCKQTLEMFRTLFH